MRNGNEYAHLPLSVYDTGYIITGHREILFSSSGHVGDLSVSSMQVGPLQPGEDEKWLVTDLSLRIVGASRESELKILDHLIVAPVLGDMAQVFYPGSFLAESNGGRRFSSLLVPTRQHFTVSITNNYSEPIEVRALILGLKFHPSANVTAANGSWGS